MIARTPLLALLVYVTLDLSLPAMPGAFVFEVSDSVESLHVVRGRAVADAGAAPPLVGAWSAVSAFGGDVLKPPAAAGTVERPSRGTVNRFARAALAAASRAPASRSEDPH